MNPWADGTWIVDGMKLVLLNQRAVATVEPDGRVTLNVRKGPCLGTHDRAVVALAGWRPVKFAQHPDWYRTDFHHRHPEEPHLTPAEVMAKRAARANAEKEGQRAVP